MNAIKGLLVAAALMLAPNLVAAAGSPVGTWRSMPIVTAYVSAPQAVTT